MKYLILLAALSLSQQGRAALSFLLGCGVVLTFEATVFAAFAMVIKFFRWMDK